MGVNSMPFIQFVKSHIVMCVFLIMVSFVSIYWYLFQYPGIGQINGLYRGPIKIESIGREMVMSIYNGRVIIHIVDNGGFHLIGEGRIDHLSNNQYAVVIENINTVIEPVAVMIVVVSRYGLDMSDADIKRFCVSVPDTMKNSLFRFNRHLVGSINVFQRIQ